LRQLRRLGAYLGFRSEGEKIVQAAVRDGLPKAEADALLAAMAEGCGQLPEELTRAELIPRVQTTRK